MGTWGLINIKTMGYVKILKNKAYSKRYQTKFRRRRQGKTDYYARKRLVVNAKDKYDTKKYRMVVRFTNYAAAYATGLLLARRLLKDKSIDDKFVGVSAADGKYYNIADGDNERRPFKAYLDVGLVRTTTGNRVFGAMKGACDGGLNIPHNEQRFPGFRWEKPEQTVGKKRGGGADEKEKPKANFSAEEHLEHIMGVHVQEYYDLLKGEKPQDFKRQFSKWEKALGGKSFEDVYKACHAAIRKNPARAKVAKKNKPVRKVVQAAPTLILQNSKNKKWLRQKKIGS